MKDKVTARVRRAAKILVTQITWLILLLNKIFDWDVRASWKSLGGDFKVCGSTLERVVAPPESWCWHEANIAACKWTPHTIRVKDEFEESKLDPWRMEMKYSTNPKKLTFHETVLKIYRTSIVITSLKRLASQLSALSEVCFIFLGTLLYRPPICASYIHQCASYICQYVCQLLLSAKTWTSF